MRLTIKAVVISSLASSTVAFSSTATSCNNNNINNNQITPSLQSTSPFFFGLGKTQLPPTSSTSAARTTQLFSSIGLGPDKRLRTEEDGTEDDASGTETDDASSSAGTELVAGVDYEIPDHEAYRTSRRSKLDEQCDAWFARLLGTENDKGVLGELADDARRALVTPVELVNEVRLPYWLLVDVSSAHDVSIYRPFSLLRMC